MTLSTLKGVVEGQLPIASLLFKYNFYRVTLC